MWSSHFMALGCVLVRCTGQRMIHGGMMPRQQKRSTRRNKAAAGRRLAGIGLTPRLLSALEAARYCGISMTQFRKEVAAGTLPEPFGGLKSTSKLWDKGMLDEMISARGGTRASGHRSHDPLMEDIKRHATKKRTS